MALGWLWWRAWAGFSRRWCRNTLAWQAWHSVTSTFDLRGRRGYKNTIFHTKLDHLHHFLRRTPSFTYHFVTHNSSHTTCFTSRSSTTSFVFPSFPVPATTFVAHYWKKWTCGVIRPFNCLFSSFLNQPRKLHPNPARVKSIKVQAWLAPEPVEFSTIYTSEACVDQEGIPTRPKDKYPSLSYVLITSTTCPNPLSFNNLHQKTASAPYTKFSFRFADQGGIQPNCHLVHDLENASRVHPFFNFKSIEFPPCWHQ